MKVRFTADKNGIEIEIEDNDNNQEYLEKILNQIDQIVDSKYNLLEVLRKEPILEKSTSNEGENKVIKEIINTNSNTNQTENIDTIAESIDQPIKDFAAQVKVDPLKLSQIYDFGYSKYTKGEMEVPPILPDVCSVSKSRSDTQRQALLLLLLATNVLNGNDSLSSKSLTMILTESSIDSTDLSKVKSTDFNKWIKIDGRSYRIFPVGVIKAKKFLNEKIASLGE
ncbi:hypothetical protein NEF87_002526 [Candidatus Lokiarchaeum ossiferum]|uniref:Uncharacterized protein n=1 Tax=Candidatus Lokiarchaeum ossiferum TaxID=2951803 RepID=A0ABY6HRV2_9ARCH|nr:hypothetical protein NEF87_002526 [Candidatus Lokiarchaeum sp. B-35]